MQPLLKIRTIPLQLEYKVNRASLQIRTEPPRSQVTRTPGQREIHAQPARVQLDTYETRASAGRKSVARSISEFAQEGLKAAQSATRAYAEGGNQIVDSHGKGDPIVDKATSHLAQMPQTALRFIPAQRPEITVQPGSLSFHYTMDKLTFDWNLQQKPQLEYVPGNIEFSVTQYNDVIIEYVGSPIYVPPSAAPDYEAPLDKTV